MTLGLPLQPTTNVERIRQGNRFTRVRTAVHLVNLYLAGIWLLLGVGLLAYEQLVPGAVAPKIPYVECSYGWLAIALAGYNLLRSWGRRNTSKAEQQRQDTKSRAELARRDREFRDSGRERDPNFIFDESPPAENR